MIKIVNYNDFELSSKYKKIKLNSLQSISNVGAASIFYILTFSKDILKRAEQIKAKQEQELRQKIEAESKGKEEVTPFDEPKATITIKEEQKIEKVETKIIPVDSDGKVMKTLSCSIRVPAEATDEQVINAVIQMIKADKFPVENIKVV